MKKQDFNKNWIYHSSLSNPMMAILGGVTPDSIPVSLPHDAMISAERKPNPVAAGIGYFTPKNVEYVKTYTPPQEDAGKITYLEFEGVYMNAVVEINENIVIRHPYGYTGFVVNISDYLVYGQPNKIKVVVFTDALPYSRWYPGTGIYRNVKLMVGGTLHIAPDGVQVTTINADEEVAAVKIAITLQNHGTRHKKVELKTIIRDKNNNVAASVSTRVNIKSNETITAMPKVFIKNPLLWGIEEPNMYTYETVAECMGEVIDSCEGSFGIRTLTIDCFNGLRLNGKTVKLKGGCIHHDNGVIGAVSLPDAEERRLRLMKESGYNAIRTAHNPFSHAMLDACDKLGMMVIHEFTDMWQHPKAAYDYSLYMAEWWERDVEDMVRVSYNHPSIIMYSIGNEIRENGTDQSASWGRVLCEKFKSLDNSRFTTNGINIMLANLDKIETVAAALGAEGVKADEINNMMTNLKSMIGTLSSHPICTESLREAVDIVDVVGYNYNAGRYEAEHKDHPNRIFVGAETNPPELDKNWALVEKNDYVLGDFSWTGWDYLGEPGVGRIVEDDGKQRFAGAFPWLINYSGDFDITGFRRPISFWREIIWGGREHAPYISVHRPENIGKKMFSTQWAWTDSINSWTHPGYEGKPTFVEVYSDAQEIELFLNGASLGIKPVGDDFKQFYCKWDVVYQPGTLEAVAYIDNKAVGSYALATSSGAKMCVKADRDSLRAGSYDLCYIEIEFRDENGNLDMTVCKSVEVSIIGSATLVGIGSGNPRSEENYISCKHKAFEGRALAVIKAGDEAGEATISVTAENEQAIVIKIPVILANENFFQN